MINIIDLILGAFILLYLLRHAGGMVGTAKNIVFVVLFLMFFGIIAQFILNLSFAEKIHKPLEDSYLVKTSHVLIRWFYPAIEWLAPKVDAFIKDKIIAGPAMNHKGSWPAPKVKPPKIVLPKEALPKLSIDELPSLK